MAVMLAAFTELQPAICQTLFHVLFTRFIFIYLWHRCPSKCARNMMFTAFWLCRFGAGLELGRSQLWPIVFPLAGSTRRPKWNQPGPATSGSGQNWTDAAQLGSGGLASPRGGLSEFCSSEGFSSCGCSHGGRGVEVKGRSLGRASG